jgi:hypothetical protein
MGLRLGDVVALGARVSDYAQAVNYAHTVRLHGRETWVILELK